MGRLSACPFCKGAGLVTFEHGPEVEPCVECGGTGRLYSDPTLRGVFEALLREKGVFADPDLRLLLRGLSALEERIERLEGDRSP